MRSMEKTFSLILKISSIISFIISLVFAFFTLSSFLERGKYGSGLLFADAEIFLILTIIFLLVGLVFIWLAKK